MMYSPNFDINNIVVSMSGDSDNRQVFVHVSSEIIESVKKKGAMVLIDLTIATARLSRVRQRRIDYKQSACYFNAKKDDLISDIIPGYLYYKRNRGNGAWSNIEIQRSLKISI